MSMLELFSRPWSQSVDELTTTQHIDIKKGLSDTLVAEAQKQHGPNIFSIETPVSPLRIFLRQFHNPLVLVLVLAILLTLVLQEWFDALIIALAVLVNTGLGFMQEHKAERAIADLRSYIVERTRVVRDGREQEIDSKELVPGDIVHLKSGDRVTADIRLLQVTNFAVDEALLTGESIPVNKHTEVIAETALLAERSNMVFAGTVVTDGTAYGVVTKIGFQTEIGQLAELVALTTSEKTPLQHAISKLAKVIIIAITLIVVIVFTLGLMAGQPLYELLLLSIAIIVGAVPEALPIGLTAVLAVGVERIAAQKGIMRSLTAAETLGSTTLIITDKTGTLTEAKMELAQIITVDQLAASSFIPPSPSKRYSQTQKSLLSLALCNSDVTIEDQQLPPAEWEIHGSPLEVNLVRAAAVHGLTLTQQDEDETIIRLPFSSSHKFSVSRIPHHVLPENMSEFVDPHVVMGAPDILLERSFMDKEMYINASASIAALSESGYRVLGLALLTPHIDHADTLTPDHVRDLTFMGVIAFVDPIRADVPDVLSEITRDGVKVVMCTGDLPGTATAIGRSLGWEIDASNIMTGHELHEVSDEALREILPRIRIFARVTPADKIRIVKLYQNLGEIVAMTGDGVNDGPALKAANIGIAIGSGTDVAKSIADLVLLNDSFKTIVTTIKEGRQMLANIKKIFVYLMSNALDEVILIGGCIIVGAALPLTAIQIIWVNLFTGSIPAIAYAFDTQPATKRGATHERFFDNTVYFLTIGVGVLTSVMLLVLYLTLLSLEVPVDTARSVLFACFSAYILVIAFSFRNLHAPLYSYPFAENRFLFFGVLGGLVLVLATLYVPFFQSLFDTTALSLWWLLFVVVWLMANILLVEIAKWFTARFLTS